MRNIEIECPTTWVHDGVSVPGAYCKLTIAVHDALRSKQGNPLFSGFLQSPYALLSIHGEIEIEDPPKGRPQAPEVDAALWLATYYRGGHPQKPAPLPLWRCLEYSDSATAARAWRNVKKKGDSPFEYVFVIGEEVFGVERPSQITITDTSVEIYGKFWGWYPLNRRAVFWGLSRLYAKTETPCHHLFPVTAPSTLVCYGTGIKSF